MKAEFRATTPADAPAIAAFLGRIFEAGPDEPIVDPRMMEWKYWKERPGWQGSRGYVLERGGSIVAHGAAWPSKILAGAGIPTFFLIDWAASSDSPGAGVSLMKHMTKIVPVIFLFGGTEVACKVRTAMGYRSRNEVRTLALPLRPVRQILSSRRWNWKMPARFARNLMWSRGGPQADNGWRAQPIDPLELSRSRVPWPAGDPQALLLERDAELFQYLTACPLTNPAFFLAMRDSEPAGYFCLTFPPGQARIAYAWVVSNQVEDWTRIYALAIQQAAQHAGVNEITAAAPNEASFYALERCGFHTRAIDPVQIFDPRGQVPPGLPLQVQLIDGDAAYRNTGNPDYLT
jgi:hypothetical protein